MQVLFIYIHIFTEKFEKAERIWMDFGICKQRLDINLAGVRWEISGCREGRMNQILLLKHVGAGVHHLLICFMMIFVDFNFTE